MNPLKLTIPPDVYSPQEDSELLADAARKYGFGDFLDLGCGSGVVGISASKNPLVKKITFADISKNALSCAKENALRNNVKNEVFIETDLFSKIKGKFDSIAFNPPYLPTSKQEKVKGLLNHAFDGGINGRKGLDKFLEKFETHLKPGGVLLLLNSSRSATGDLDGNSESKKVLEEKGFAVEAVFHRKFFFEELLVFKAVNY